MSDALLILRLWEALCGGGVEVVVVVGVRGEFPFAFGAVGCVWIYEFMNFMNLWISTRWVAASGRGRMEVKLETGELWSRASWELHSPCRISSRGLLTLPWGRPVQTEQEMFSTLWDLILPCATFLQINICPFLYSLSIFTSFIIHPPPRFLFTLSWRFNALWNTTDDCLLPSPLPFSLFTN